MLLPSMTDGTGWPHAPPRAAGSGPFSNGRLPPSLLAFVFASSAVNQCSGFSEGSVYDKIHPGAKRHFSAFRPPVCALLPPASSLCPHSVAYAPWPR